VTLDSASTTLADSMPRYEIPVTGLTPTGVEVTEKETDVHH
jgi:hypothetical protein